MPDTWHASLPIDGTGPPPHRIRVEAALSDGTFVVAVFELDEYLLKTYGERRYRRVA